MKIDQIEQPFVELHNNKTDVYDESLDEDAGGVQYPIAVSWASYFVVVVVGILIKESKLICKFEKPVYGAETTLFTHFMAPGIAITVIFFLSVAATASNFVLERRLGLLERSYLSGEISCYFLYSLIFFHKQFCLVFLFQTKKEYGQLSCFLVK